MLAALLELIQYATVRPFYGCPEVASLARPYLTPMAYGFGFGLVWLWDRRRVQDRRAEPSSGRRGPGSLD